MVARAPAAFAVVGMSSGTCFDSNKLSFTTVVVWLALNVTVPVTLNLPSMQLLTASAVVNWKKDPYSRGAYSYDTVGSIEAKKILNTPIEGTIYFAGEAFYEGTSPGTVEAALVSAKNVVEKIVGGEM